MSQSERLQYIIRKLNHADGVSRREIAETFEISYRQAGRDIEYLRERMGAPISYSARTRRYHLATIWDTYANVDERIIITGAYLKSLFTKVHLGPYFEEEITKSLYMGISDEVRRVLDRIEYRGQHFDIPDWAILSTVIDAFALRHCLRIEYENLSGETSSRTIEPGRLISYNNTWYVVAYDHKREATRTFHLSRIRTAQTLDEPMSHEISVSDGGYGIYLSDKLIEYRIRFSGAAARIVSTQVWSDEQKLERQDDGSLIMTLKSSSIEELVPAILAFADEAEPLSPQAFVDAYMAQVERLMGKYRAQCSTEVCNRACDLPSCESSAAVCAQLK